MTLKELADKLESLDVNVFANILGLEYTHDEEPEQAKKKARLSARPEI